MIDWNELFTCKDGKLFNRSSGKETGSKGGLFHNRKHYRTYRVIWEMHHGSIPKDREIDHIDRDRKNNNLSNLRLVTRSQNMQNRKGLGYRRMPDKVDGTKRYKALIVVNRKTFYLGTYPNPYEAHGAYLEAKREMCGEYAPQ